MFAPLKQNLNLSGGQLAASSTAITTGAANKARRLNLTLCNTGSQTETIYLTITINGSTARRLRKLTLDPDEQYFIAGLPLNIDDTLYGYSTNASAVDYIVSVAAEAADLEFHAYDEDGTPKRLNVSPGQLLALAEE